MNKTIDVQVNHGKSREQLDDVARGLMVSMSKEYGIAIKRLGDNGIESVYEAFGSGFTQGLTGKMTIGPFYVRVILQLPFLLLGMRKSIEDGVREKLVEALR